MNLIELFTDPGDVVIDPVAGSGSTLLAAENLGRTGVGFEIKKEFCAAFEARMRPAVRETLPIFGGGDAA
jgi:site-specific DNA-methyltransferase (adenine-specific)